MKATLQKLEERPKSSKSLNIDELRNNAPHFSSKAKDKLIAKLTEYVQKQHNAISKRQAFIFARAGSEYSPIPDKLLQFMETEVHLEAISLKGKDKLVSMLLDRIEAKKSNVTILKNTKKGRYKKRADCLARQG